MTEPAHTPHTTVMKNSVSAGTALLQNTGSSAHTQPERNDEKVTRRSCLAMTRSSSRPASACASASASARAPASAGGPESTGLDTKALNALESTISSSQAIGKPQLRGDGDRCGEYIATTAAAV